MVDDWLDLVYLIQSDPPSGNRAKKRGHALQYLVLGQSDFAMGRAHSVFPTLYIDDFWLVGGLEHEFPFSWEFHNPNWRTPSFFRGVGLNHQPVDGCFFVSWYLMIHDTWSMFAYPAS